MAAGQTETTDGGPRQVEEIWREPVRGGFMDPSLFALPGMERMQALYRGLTPVSPVSHLLGGP